MHWVYCYYFFFTYDKLYFENIVILPYRFTEPVFVRICRVEIRTRSNKLSNTSLGHGFIVYTQMQNCFDEKPFFFLVHDSFSIHQHVFKSDFYLIIFDFRIIFLQRWALTFLRVKVKLNVNLFLTF